MVDEFSNNQSTEDKRKIIKSMTNFEYYPTILEEQISLEKYTKLPLLEVMALGAAFQPLASMFQNVIKTGESTSKLYKVTVPRGRELAKFKDGSGYLGSVLKENGSVGAGQARLNPLVFNPEILLIAGVLIRIEKRFDNLEKAQKEILDFLIQKEKSEIKGNLNFLFDILNNYKYNWDNEKYKSNNHIKVLDIRQSAEGKIDFYRQQIKSKINKRSFFYTEQLVKKQLEEIQLEFKGYQSALYMYSFSSFLEVMLLENFNSKYLDIISNRIEDYSFKYRELYTESYNQIEGNAKSSIESHIVNKIANANKFAGKAIPKAFVVKKIQIDEKLIETGDNLGRFGSKRIEDIMKEFVEKQKVYVSPFVENINEINRLYNQPIELIFDQDNIYIGLEG